MPWAKVPVRTTASRVSLWGFRGETPGEHRCYSFLSGPNITLAKAARITGSKIEPKVSQTHRLAPLAGAGPKVEDSAEPAAEPMELGIFSAFI